MSLGTWLAGLRVREWDRMEFLQDFPVPCVLEAELRLQSSSGSFLGMFIPGTGSTTCTAALFLFGSCNVLAKTPIPALK